MTTNNRWRVLAYNRRGQLVWASRGVKRKGYPKDAVISESGRTLYVTGTSHESNERKRDITTVAYRTNDGKARWRVSYDGEMSRRDEGHAIALDSERDRLYISGESEGGEAIRDKDSISLRYDLRGTKPPKLAWDRVTHSNPRWYAYGDVEMSLGSGGSLMHLVRAHMTESSTAIVDQTYDWRYETQALSTRTGETVWSVVETPTTLW